MKNIVTKMGLIEHENCEEEAFQKCTIEQFF